MPALATVRTVALLAALACSAPAAWAKEFKLLPDGCFVYASADAIHFGGEVRVISSPEDGKLHSVCVVVKGGQVLVRDTVFGTFEARSAKTADLQSAYDTTRSFGEKYFSPNITLLSAADAIPEAVRVLQEVDVSCAVYQRAVFWQIGPKSWACYKPGFGTRQIEFDRPTNLSRMFEIVTQTTDFFKRLAPAQP